MTDTKFTPGPWVYDERHPFNAYSDDATGSIVATAGAFQYAPRPDAEKIANAHLIAAAPDLYAALEGARETILRLINARGSEVEGSDADWTFEIDAALAKARGRA